MKASDQVTSTASTTESQDSENDANSITPLSARNTRESHTNPPENGSSKAKPVLQKAVRRVIDYFKDQWFLIGLGVVIAIASQVQVPAGQQDFKEMLVSYLCVSIIFLITGCTLPSKVLIQNYSRWKIHIFVQVSCFLMTSATTFGIVSATATNRSFMDPVLLVGMIFAGIVPTTISSNVVLTRQANGNTALTVVQSTLGNLLGPFIAPLLLSMYTSTGAWYTEFLPNNGNDYGEVYRRVFKQLGLSLFVPLVS
jgi:solute carrier family 10 (sodium/bile acid cotransporter), member 7